ncbi:uncharacterized protein [Nicotiana sylvestris]|uniref:uncharacterized protein n=1 Tax=Nicotiana sylvestris TaxID=4096 RepID=UPI00388CAAEF
MSTLNSYLLLLGLRSVQPYAPQRVLRQLGRYQVVPDDKDLSMQVIELHPEATLPEALIQQMWNGCRYLKDDTQVPDPAKGEINPGYARWFEKRSRVDDAPEPDLRKPVKRPHVQAFDDKIQERLAWGEKEKRYKATIHALEESLRNLNLEKDLQAQEVEGEKKSLICKNKNLRAQFQQMKKASEAPVRSWKDQKIIANLMEKMQDYDSILSKTEKALGKAKEKIRQLNEEAKSNKERQLMRFEEDMAQFKKEKNRWIHSEAQLHVQLEETRRYNREHQHADIDRERAQNKNSVEPSVAVEKGSSSKVATKQQSTRGGQQTHHSRGRSPRRAGYYQASNPITSDQQQGYSMELRMGNGNVQRKRSQGRNL